MNAPDRFELYVLADGEPKLTVEEDTKIPNAATVTINKEDHTLAGMLRAQLLQMPDVLFAGYKVPHPLEPRFLLKIQTISTSTPIQAVQEAIKALIVTLSNMREAFQKEFDTAKTMATSFGIGAPADQQEQMAPQGAGHAAMDEGLGGAESYEQGGFSEFV